ncbi:3-hydroxyacyl-thioester dehydratase HtdZ [Ramlibacter solisilvae]|uniref:Dehydratase n=1 Tax=Ramlibacter tataouinensis TaxID=94132 RepID=A0A127JXF1_9BURK|nr:MaoC family dehydratase [Ramlibacter tataouinensis]AMO22742.1 dehydratase [Ramlibacter tataouinensis]
MKSYETLADLKPLVGEVIGTSDWILIDQQRINLFADATGDHQWIHVDVERAKTGPFGKPIAHGFLTLSLMSAFFYSGFEIRKSAMGVNYGLNKVRFIQPVPAGSRVRGHFRLLAWDAIDNGAQLTIEVSMEMEGSDKPVCVAESITRRF